jgi:hypothetical protein
VGRTYPFSAGALALEGGVLFGMAAAALTTFTTAAPKNKNRHMCWYGTSGVGKACSLRVAQSRAIRQCTAYLRHRLAGC